MKLKKVKEKIKVASIIEEARIGGPQIRLMSVVTALKKKVDVTIIFPIQNSNEFQNRCQEFKIKYLTSKITTIHRKWFIILRYLILFPYETINLALILKKKNFNLVHIVGGSWQYKGLLAAKLAGIKVVWELNDSFVPFIFKIIFFFTNNLADSFVYGSKNTKKYYEKIISKKKKTFLIQSPVDTKLFNPKLKFHNENLIKQFRGKKKIIIGMVANINPAKDLLTLIKSIEILQKKKINFACIVIGSIFNTQKNYFQELNNYIINHNIKDFYFLDSRKDVRSLLKDIDIYVCSSQHESSPLSVWEAMSMAKAIVSTNVGDIGKFIVNGKSGYVVNVKDEKNLAIKINQMIKNPKMRKKFGFMARKTAIQNLDLRICVKKHIEMYKHILN